MTQAEKEFIIDTLETAIEWADYADDYFKKKHGLDQDRENVKKAIIILKLPENPKTCDGCKWQHNHQVRVMFCSHCTRQVHLKDNFQSKDTL